MAASRIAVLDDSYLCGDTLAHRVGVADHTYLFALRGLKHGQGVDDGCQHVGVECSESFVDKQIFERDVAR